jgi:ribosomal protein L37AE/L43A
MSDPKVRPAEDVVAPVLSRHMPTGATCEHPRMTECCPGCGHWHCPDCGLTYDEGTDFPQTELSRPTKEDFE